MSEETSSLPRGADLSGVRIGSVTVLAMTATGKLSGRHYLVRCECGREYELRSSRVRHYASRGQDYVCIECHSKRAGRVCYV